MLETLQTIAVALVTFGIVVAVHEYGHFWVARRNNVKIWRFSIGFGRPLVRWQGRDAVEYVIAAIPLGGYVRMADEREGNVPPEDLPRAHNRQSVKTRSAIAAAGPAANFLLALLVLWGLFLRGESGLIPVIDQVTPQSPASEAGLESGWEIVSIDGQLTPTISAVNFALLERLGDTGELILSTRLPGSDVTATTALPINTWLKGVEQPNLLASLGVSMRMPPVIPKVQSVTTGGPADRAGVRSGDLIVSADGLDMALWMDWVTHVRSHPGQSISLNIERAGQLRELVVVPDSVVAEGGTIGSVGMTVAPPIIPDAQQRRFERGPVAALMAAIDRTGALIGFTLKSIGKMLQGLISPANLSGPITIAQVAASSAEVGLAAWCGFLALLSVSLGVLNLLPIPVLDGGHLLFYAWEALRGRPLPERVQNAGYQVGLALVLSIMVFALYNDVSKF